MNNNKRIRRRTSFDNVAELYDKARPAYPTELINDLVELSGLSKESRVLEIGCGTGQLTMPLAALGVSLLAVEFGTNLATIAREKLAGFQQVDVVVADFDQWPLPPELFDLVVAATAFHWLDPNTRVQKCVNALRPGGILATIDTRWGIGPSRDRFSIESQSCYARWDPNHDPNFQLPILSDLPEDNEELNSSNYFQEILLKRYNCIKRFTAKEYSNLLRTFSNVREFDTDTRSGFIACIEDLIESRFDGEIMRYVLYNLWIARTPIISKDA